MLRVERRLHRARESRELSATPGIIQHFSVAGIARDCEQHVSQRRGASCVLRLATGPKQHTQR
jgi:hypothetical protein